MDTTIDVVMNGAGSAPLARILEIATVISRAPIAAVAMRDGDTFRLLVSRGLAAAGRDVAYGGRPARDLIFAGCNVYGAAQLAHVPRAPGLPPWTWAASVPVSAPAFPDKVALICADTRDGVARPGDMLSRLAMLASVIADDLSLCTLFAAQETQLQALLANHVDRSTGAPLPARVSAPAAPITGTMPAAADGSLVDFLDKTLISSPRLLHRGDIGYHALRRWRASIKEWQLHGMKALKSARSRRLIDLAADEMAAATVRLYGAGIVEQVVGVPCGNSGPDCLSQRLAEAVALRLDVPACRAFADIGVVGTSHPRRNPGRPAMRLREPVTAPTLLVDDIATSGAHIAEAARILRTDAPAVLPMVWLAAT